MDTTVNENLHRKLKKVLSEDGTVLFIGAGISAWSGLPGWGQLLNEMADYVEHSGGDSTNIRNYSNSQPLLAADFGCSALQNEDFNTFIRSACRLNVAKPSVVHQLLIDLGVSCYITTNYDQLLEQALRQNGTLSGFKVITNREPTDCAGLLHLRRRGFIFKPHGDVDQVESIVLSNKQYNDLYENGNKFYTYRAIETLLTTRDVVFVGFGLTDPDFMRIMGKIRNEFGTNLNTHYAIMPDISQSEKKYWAENYGIQILSYATKKTENGRDYSALLEVLGSLATKSRKSSKLTMKIQKRKSIKFTKKQKMILGRYSRYVIQQLKVPDGPVFPLIFQCHNKYRTNYENIPVADVLAAEIRGFILTGNPGAGKTYFLKQYCLVQAERLQNWCEQGLTGASPKVPVYVDLKGYSGRGSIKALIEAQFPAEIPILEWINKRKVVLFFDSFNEVERKYLENGSCAQEIRQYAFYNDVIIATRFKNAIDIYLPEYRLEEVEQEYVEEFLENKEIVVPMDSKEMVVQLLQKPLMFNLLVQGKIKIDHTTTPRNIYESYFECLNDQIRRSLKVQIDFTSIFDAFAYRMFESGLESFSIGEIEELFSEKVSELKAEECKTLINWLIDEQQFMIPTSLNNISFFHQAITEFLAAHFFANEFKENPDILWGKLQYLRWNYVLLFAIEFLDKEQSEKYMAMLLQSDTLLAVQACSYVEQSANQMVTTILQYLLKSLNGRSFDYCIELGELLEKLPVQKMHQDMLRELMAYKDVVGGAAAGCLLRACGDNVKYELLEEMFQNLDRNQYNYLASIGEALSLKISLEDYAAIILRLGSRIEITQDEETESLAYGFDTLAQYLPLAQVVGIFQPVGQLNSIQRQVLVDILRNAESQEGFELCIDLFRQGWKEAIFPLYMYARFNDNLCLDCIDESLIQHLVSHIQEGDVRWTIELIHALYQRCLPFAAGIRARLKQSHGVLRLAYLYAIGKNRKKSFFSHYRSMLYGGELPKELIGVFDEFDWGKEAAYIIEYLLYKNRLQDLSRFLSGNFKKTGWYDLSLTTFLKLLKAIDEMECNNVNEDNSDIKNSVGEFISKYISKEDILSFYHITSERIRRFFNFYVLNYVEDMELQDFSETEINFMLEDIKQYSFEKDIIYDNEVLLANITSEEFAVNTLKPLLGTENVCLRENIQLILEKASENQLMRYIER